MPRACAILAACVLLTVASIRAAAQSSFNDVPPWHWAAPAVTIGSGSGILVGHPAGDRDQIVNALVQIYDSLLHPQHPGAADWAARFLADLPPIWPEPLRRSRLSSYRLDQVRVEGSGDRRIVSFVVEATMPTRAGFAAARSRVLVQTVVRRDQERWRVSYDGLAARQPLLFK